MSEQTPAQELHAAAAKLREKAKPLLGGDIESQWSDFFAEHGAELGLIREDEEWISLFGPRLAEPLAAWLEYVAEVWTFCKRSEREHALAVARVINGGATP